MTPSANNPHITLLEKEFGISGTLSHLPGENENYLVATPTGDKFVLKITPPEVPLEWLVTEQEVVEALAQSLPDLHFPTPIYSKSGHLAAELDQDGDYGNQLARLYHFVAEQAWNEVFNFTLTDYARLGARIGTISNTLSEITVSGTERSHPWDLRRLDEYWRKASLFEDPYQRDLVEQAMVLWTAGAKPYLDSLPHQLIHGDINDENIRLEGTGLSGLLDFSDCLVNPTVCELAIALAYLLLEKPKPFSAGAAMVSGFHQAHPLNSAEIEVLFPLMCGRLVMSLVHSAERRKIDPMRSSWFATEQSAWRALEAFMAIDPAGAADQLAKQTGIEVFRERGVGPSKLLTQRKAEFSSALSLTFDDPINFARGRGAYLFDNHSQPFLDLYNNVPHVGHCHPQVVEAAYRQMSLLNTNTRYLYDKLHEYADRLKATLPESLQTCFFVNSGTEANELALRLARVHTGQESVFVLEHAYHGHTRQMTQISPYKFMGPGGSGVSEPWVHILPIPDGFRGRYKGQSSTTGSAYAEEAAYIINSSENDPACFIAETLPSVAGQIIPPKGYFDRVFSDIRVRNGVCILDEVQVGFGRIGTHFWAFETFEVVPDIIVLGNPIGNSHPIGAVVTTAEVANSFSEAGMEFFSTFGGNPVSCAVGLAVLAVIQSEGLQENALQVGEVLQSGLKELQNAYPIIGDVRGAGLFIGVELVKDQDSLDPAPAETTNLVNALRQRRILTGIDGPFKNVIKIKPPMVVSRDDATWAVGQSAKALKNI